MPEAICLFSKKYIDAHIHMSEPQRYILDSSALLKHPEILSRAGSRKLVIPEAVLLELSARGREGARTGITSLIHQATARGAKIVPSPSSIKNELLASDRNAQRLNGADFDLARIASDYADRLTPSAVCVVTSDRALAMFLSSRGIRSITGGDFLGESATDPTDVELQGSATTFIKSQWLHFAASLVFGALGSLIASFAYSNISFLVSTISVWGTVVALPCLGVFLYWYRQRFRLSYGVFEFIVGVMMTYYVFFPSFNYAALSVVEGIQILGGLYVMVRGLDNVAKGVEGTRFEPLWKTFFG